jgi:RNase H-fold protein (predicted Holliday junction resolvase)
VRVLAVDPGREKCGVAVCSPEGIVARRVVALADLPGLVRDWVDALGVGVVLIGDQTGCKQVFDLLSSLSLPVTAVAERGTTLLARRRYFQDHPPMGWRRLLPLTFQVPQEAYDDYAAVVLAEIYLKSGTSEGGHRGGTVEDSGSSGEDLR